MCARHKKNPENLLFSGLLVRETGLEPPRLDEREASWSNVIDLTSNSVNE